MKLPCVALLLFALSANFSIIPKAWSETSSKAACTTPAESSDFETVEATAAAATMIVGNYSNQSFRETCHLIFPDAQGKGSQCSATWVGGTRLITAAHCELSAMNTSASCFCGIDPYTKKEVFTTVKVMPGSKANSNYNSTQFGYDIRVAHLANAPACPSQFPQIKPAVFAPSLAEAKKLLASGRCYFSGFGQNNSRNIGNLAPASTDSLHSVATPKEFSFVDQRGSEAVVHKSLGGLSALRDEKKLEIEQFIKDKKLNKKQAAEARKQLNAQLEVAFKKEFTAVQKDKNGINGIDHGDSGGSLICLGSEKEPKHYLIGVPVTIFQTSTLINDPEIWNWLKANP